MSPSGTRLSIKLLGGFAVTVGARVVAEDEWRLLKARALVKLLALAPHHRLAREQAMDALWPDADADAARRNFSYALHIARRALDRDDTGAAIRPSLLLLEDGILRLRAPGGLRIDTDAFIAAAKAAEASETLDIYGEALDRYEGDLLPDDRYEDWAAGPREILRERHLELLAGAARLHLAGGDLVASRRAWQTIVQIAPSHEESHLALMRLYARTGQRALALRQYAALHEALDRDLGVAPGAEVRAFYASLRVDGRTEATAAPPDRATLPTPLTPFLGRATELATLAPLLDPATARSRLVTLVGAGGSGKTRLALEAARLAATVYPDGVWCVELAAEADPERLPGALALALGLGDEPGRDPAEALIGALRARRTLLVVDNCEHLRDACAALASTLLASCPALRLLATSREPLGVPGELVWRVPALALPPTLPADLTSAAALAALADADAVRFFLDRLALRDPAIVLSGQNAAAIFAICQRLDGLPLALELAAARAPALGLSALAARLDNALHLLGGGASSAPPRHRTLRATLDWSHALLGPAEAHLLHQLAIFLGDWTLSAAEAICADGPLAADDVALLLAQLVDRSLVLTLANGRETRYRLLETVRQYALERLGRDAGEAARARHATYYLGLAETARAVSVSSEQERWLDLLDAERHNLRAALVWTLVAGELTLAARFGMALEFFWAIRGHHLDGHAQLIRLLALADAQADRLTGDARERAEREVRLPTLRSAGRLAYVVGDYPAARDLLARSVALAEALGDDATRLGGLLFLGYVALHRGQYAEAERVLEFGLTLAREGGQPYRAALFLNARGLAVAYQGRVDAARTFLREGIAILRRDSDLVNLSSALNMLGEVAFGAGDLDEARACQEESLLLARRVDAGRAVASAASALGHVAAAGGHRARARDYFGEGLTLARDRRAWWYVASCLDGLANLAALDGQVERARHLRAAALGLRDRLGMVEPPNWDFLALPGLAARRDLQPLAHYPTPWPSLEDAIAVALSPEIATSRGCHQGTGRELAPPRPGGTMIPLGRVNVASEGGRGPGCAGNTGPQR